MKVRFQNFWPDFNPESNIFMDSLRLCFEGMELAENYHVADITIQSIFGLRPEQLNQPRTVTFIGEPIAPTNAWGVTLGNSVNRELEGHFPLPLYLLQLNWFQSTDYRNPCTLFSLKDLYRSRDHSIIPRKSIDLIAVTSHDPTGNRLPLLSTAGNMGLNVSAFGKPFGNGGFSNDVKYYMYASAYFALSYESAVLPGYQSEKLIHTYFSGAVPVFWGWKDHRLNPNAIVDRSEFSSDAQMVDYLILLVNDRDSYKRKFMEPLFATIPTFDDVVSPILASVNYATKV